MATLEAIADLKSFVMGFDSKVTLFTSRLDSVEQNLIHLITEVKSDVVQVRSDLSTTKTEQDENIWQVVDNFFLKELGIEKFKAESFPLANAHRIPSRAPVVGKKKPDAIIVRFMHYEDKQVIMQNAYKVANKKIRIVDDLPVIMKEAQNDLAKAAFKIRNDEQLQTRIKVRGIVLVLETRLNSKDVWNTRKTINCVR
ncbi:Hypothetical predicted protein [Mytilus galloprovincialis]|uniref:Uncharacterized protein n=1 Tax=Mytilus galloprovincialis TaxID=29158 RepID=A0A8B6E6X7_MYTGA|nr:Hypothetical predicted protein [Mytilus galloprovincialis]